MKLTSISTVLSLVALYLKCHDVGVTAAPLFDVESSARQFPLLPSLSHDRPAGVPQVSLFHGRNGKRLQGRFLHITDIHPDRLYVANSDVNTGCHYAKPKPKKKDRAAYWGASMSDCDSPLNLVNITFDWLETEWADKIDFVIWTGDNARHDNDRGHPRTPAEIYELNRMIAARMEDTFTRRGIPVVPSLGNNDIWPHNIMYPGPSSITNEYSSIWSEFIPFESYQVFQRGAYFSFDIIPNQLGALSLNTLYWYDNNKAVEGCKKGEPGRLELEWLEVQLEAFRDRGMQVWISGHVPPSPGNYFPDCYKRYGKLVLRFQDTIVGQLFGHMNTDHFFWIDTEDVRKPPPVASSAFHFHAPETQGRKATLADDLRVDFRALPKIKKLNMDSFSIINVGPSVIPTYYPSVRVFTYNVTGQANDTNGYGAGSEAVVRARLNAAGSNSVLLDDLESDLDYDELDELDEEELILEAEVLSTRKLQKIDLDEQNRRKKKKSGKRRHGHRRHKRDVDCRLIKNEGKKACRSKKPRHTNTNSPSRSNTLWTPLGYSQFIIDNLDDFNETSPPTYTLEYMTYNLSVLDQSDDYPVPHRLLPNEIVNSTSDPAALARSQEQFAPYSLSDLTIESWIRLAKRIGNGKHKKLWKRFKAYMYMDFGV